jgi:fatty acid desaturase
MLTHSPTENLQVLPPVAAIESVEQFPGTRDIGTKRVLPVKELVADIRRLSEISESRALFAVSRQWIVLASTLGLFVTISSHLSWAIWIPAYIVACLLIATRQHAFLAIIHDGAHYRLSHNRVWNDFLSDFFCAFPVGMSTDVYRRLHLLHHQHTNTSQDPDWVGMNMQEDWHWPKDHLSTGKLFLFDLIGLGAHKILILLFMWSPLQAAVQKHVTLSVPERIRLVGFCAIVAGGLTFIHGWTWFFLLWVIPMCTFLGAMVRMRAISEHLVCPSENELNESRHVEAGWFERMTIAPLNTNYHLAHHLFPSVPWYNLPKLHARLQQLEVFKQHAKISMSYLNPKTGVLGEILKTPSNEAA